MIFRRKLYTSELANLTHGNQHADITFGIARSEAFKTLYRAFHNKLQYCRFKIRLKPDLNEGITKKTEGLSAYDASLSLFMFSRNMCSWPLTSIYAIT